ncbi:MAG: hydroxyethylthiazole kinase, partial [Candidatus Nanohalarchaeota archaeon]
ETRPIIHHITNYVTVNDCANVTLAIGAAPVMAHAKEEVSEMTSISSALLLNIGTLDPQQIESMLIAGKTANEKNIPIILDPCGAGATTFRTQTAKKLTEQLNITIIKGNASEIAAIADIEAETHGVELGAINTTPEHAAWTLAEKTNSTIIITGKEDIIADRTTTYTLRNGSPMTGKITGGGCMAASITASFTSIEKDPLIAGIAALTCFNVAQQLAEKKSTGPMDYKKKLIDELYNLTPEKIKDHQNYEKTR